MTTMTTLKTTTSPTTGRALVLFGLLAAAFSMLLLSACGTMPQRDGDLGARLSLGAGGSHVKATLAGESDSATDTQTHGARVEVYRRPDYIENTTIGVRAQGTSREVTEDGLGDGTGKLVLDVGDLELQGVIRHYFPTSDTARLFVEGFGGVAYSDGRVTASGSGLASPVGVKGDDWGPVLGGGIGFEFDLSEQASIFLQTDYEIRWNDPDPFKFRTQDVMLWVGGEIRF